MLNFYHKDECSVIHFRKKHFLFFHVVPSCCWDDVVRRSHQGVKCFGGHYVVLAN